MKLPRRNIPRSHDKSLGNFSGALIRNRYDGTVCNTCMTKEAGLELRGRDLMALKQVLQSVSVTFENACRITGYLDFYQFLQTVNDP